ncbi:MAG: hypothetical protein ACI8ZM_002823 [Crocinitomix sp.]|jgi:hypothetical protein
MVMLLLFGCTSNVRKGSEIKASEKYYIQELGLLAENEEIILFDSQSSFEVSGNFFTDKRMASYWQNDKPHEDHTTFAYYENIDTIILINRIADISYASYLEVHVNDNSYFKVYTDGDSATIHNFYNEALAQWQKINKAWKTQCACTSEFGQFDEVVDLRIDSVYNTPVALEFFANYNWVLKFDNPDKKDSLPAHFEKDRQQIYNSLDNRGFSVEVRDYLQELTIPAQKAHYTDEFATFMVNKDYYTISLAQFEKFDGLVLYNPPKKPVFWNSYNKPHSCTINEALNCYFN